MCIVQCQQASARRDRIQFEFSNFFWISKIQIFE
jgi:hypothetical protein